MGTIVDKLNKLLTTKSDIKAALIEKGQSATDLFSQYPTLIRNIIKLSSISVTTNPTKTSYTAKESFSSSGMVVRATFSNSAYKNVTGYTVSPSGALKPTDKSVTISYKEFGETKTTTVSISVAAIKVTVPSQNGSLTYTGSSLSPTWKNYNTSLMTISGTTSGTNAGSYTAKFTLKDKTNYTWSDGTTADKSVTWTIGKAQASISLSKNSITLNSDKLTDTVTITSVGMNSIAAMSSDTSIATISMSGNTLTISNVNETTGTATIVLSGEVNSNYSAPSYPTIAVNAEFAVPCTVRISGYAITPTGNTNVTINGQTYSAKGLSTTLNNATPIAEITVPSGTVMSCSTLVPSGQALINSATSLNGTVVAQQTAAGVPVTYDYVVNSDIYVELMDATIYGSPMSMNMSKISITEIPEGHILLTVSGTLDASYAYYTLDGTQRTNTGMFAIAPDSVLTVYVDENIALASHLGMGKATITLNGTTVVENDMRGNYTIPLGDASEVKLNFTKNSYTSNDETSYWGVCNITAVPEGHALVNIGASGTGISATFGSLTINGTTYASTTAVAVPVGTVITCVSKTDEDDDSNIEPDYGYWGDYANIYLNGNRVGTYDSGSYTTTYEYTVTGNVGIGLQYNKGRSNIVITEPMRV